VRYYSNKKRKIERKVKNKNSPHTRAVFDIYKKENYLTTTENNPRERVLRRRRDDIFWMNILGIYRKCEEKQGN
jgi:hypothetical protein